MKKLSGGTCAAVLAVASLLSAGLSGCSAKVETSSTPSADAADPQKDLSGQSVAGVLPKQQLEDMLLERLAANQNQPPDTVDCASDLQAKTGNTVECTVATDLAGQVYLVTVTTVEGDTVNFAYEVKP